MNLALLTYKRLSIKPDAVEPIRPLRQLRPVEPRRSGAHQFETRSNVLGWHAQPAKVAFRSFRKQETGSVFRPVPVQAPCKVSANRPEIENPRLVLRCMDLCVIPRQVIASKIAPD